MIIFFLFLEPVAITFNYETLPTDSLQLKGHGICTDMYFAAQRSWNLYTDM